MFFEIDFESDMAIYEQIRRAFIVGLARGNLKKGDKLPSVRDLAEEIGINLHTVNKAYKLLASDGFIVMDRRFGSMVGKDFEPVNDKEGQIIKDELAYLASFAKLKGLGKEDFIAYIENIWEDKND